MSYSECLIDGLGSVLEYTEQKIKVLVGSQVITFYGDDLHINSFTHEGAIVEGAIISIEFSSQAV
ncbi:MAG: YabP/YqfC family sporulation protein [Clostridiales bacterium]|nr:YabP/YqfC family sporulation protein [Clostridiales bacterium]